MQEQLEVSAALDQWVSIYERMTPADSFHESLNYPEAEALANLLAVAGRHDLAQILIEEWAEGDPEAAEDYAEDLADYIEHCKIKQKEVGA